MDLTKLLKPKSVALVGASEKTGFGGDTIRNILAYKDKDDLGRVYFVNPRRDQVFGIPCYNSLSDIDDTIDLLIIATPQATVIPLLEEGAKKGVGGAVVYASGYGEVGTEEGRQNEKELKETAERLGIAVMGPNCAGFVNYIDQVYSYAFISAERDRRGSVGVISQSGQLCLSMMEDPGMRFSYNISAGNAKLVQMEDYMEFLVDDPDTKVIALYIEGVKNPDKFVAMLKKAAQKRKPVVLLKVGRSAKSQAIAASHTGSLTGSDKSFDAVLKKFGAIRVDDLEELIAMSMLLSTLHVFPKKAAFSSMSLSGGETSIIADVASQQGVYFPDFEQKTLDKLGELLPSYATPNNPLDMTATPSYDTEKFAAVVKTVADDPNVGMILLGYTLLYEIADPAIHYMYAGLEKAIQEGLDKPVAMLPFAENTRNPEYQAKLFNIGVPVLPPPVYGFKLLKYLSDYVEYFEEEKTHELAAPERKAENAVALSEFESKKVLAEYGVPVPEELIAKTEDEAAGFAEKTGLSYAMKIESADILHKSDVGGVKLNISGGEAARAAFREITDNVRSHRPDAKINGILMAPMLKKGVEMIVGVSNDPQYGPMVMVGMGGVFVEVFKDVALYPAPLSKSEALAMLKGLKSYRLLGGYRGGEPCDIDALCDTIVAIGDFAAANKDKLKELDINPLFVYPDGVGVADALVVMER